MHPFNILQGEMTEKQMETHMNKIYHRKWKRK